MRQQLRAPATPSSIDIPNDVGTLWTLQRDEGTARCALFWRPDGWELRMLIDGLMLLAHRCCRQDEVFAVAETWRVRLRERGWHDLEAPVTVRPKPDRRRA